MRLFGGDASKPADPRPHVVFVSHEATRTGAPLIVLNLLKHFAKNPDIQFSSLLHNGGHLVSEFGEHSETDCLNLPRKHSEDLSRRVRRLITRNRAPMPQLAICNSMESRFIARELADLHIPVLFLIHELPSSYTEDDYASVFSLAKQIVFPIEGVKKETGEKFAFPDEKTTVLSQGLLNPEFGKDIVREKVRAKLRRDLRIPANSHIVLGCGTLDLRKGIDHFAGVARATLKLYPNPEERPIHFVWVGEGPRWTHSTFHYVQLDMRKSGIEDHVHFVGEHTDVEPFFFGSDTFLLPSRVDPFPCVIHEAMAAELPIITFDQSGGACEAVKDGAGIVVPYGDYVLAANMIRLLDTQQHIANSIREKSLKRVHEEYRFDDYADRIMKIAESVSGLDLGIEQDEGPTHLPFAA